VSDNLLRVNPATTTQRLSAEERREEILAAAMDLFAQRGLYGTSTDEIARRAGISQPYLFRLFGTKKELYLATVERCYEETLEMFREASAGKTGEEALHAISKAYHEAVLRDPLRLQGQMQAYAACSDADVREVCRKGYGRLVEHVEAVSGFPPEEVRNFFALGMFLNVIASMQLLDSKQKWTGRMLQGLWHK
jgi:AcrR family transcriptional regulator